MTNHLFESKISAINKMNQLGKTRRPFLFVIDYEMNECLVEPLDKINAKEIKYQFNDAFCKFQNFENLKSEKQVSLEIEALRIEKYQKAFDLVKQNLANGNSFLCNLTVETPIKLDIEIDEIVKLAKAKYMLTIKNKFVCFSPEPFVSVDAKGKISSFPMKGTIDANLTNAENIILNDEKEKFEHTTIVDLIRNDLSKVAKSVWVERFRYIEKLQTANRKSLLQVSSEICGQLPAGWKENIGDWFFELLPAGSITGAPKPKTIEIIKEAEAYTYKSKKRGFYSGVFGVFDGEILTSAVMIRFIEKTKNGLVFKSGGGITNRSDLESEYNEMLQKIYLPSL